MPFWAVFQADFASLVRSWVLRVWLLLTMLFALVVLFNRAHPLATGSASTDRVLAAVLRPAGSEVAEPDISDDARVLRELLRSYVVIWTTFVILLTGGTICSELGVMADSVLSRSISRWQYYLAKWSARLCAVLGVYLLVMVPTTLVMWLRAGTGELIPAHAATDIPDMLLPASAASIDPGSLTLIGIVLALTHIAVVLAAVVTGGVALSASFSNTVISITVAWVTLYGSGLMFSMLDLKYLSPERLLASVPDLLRGRYVLTDQWWSLGTWLSLVLVMTLVSGTVFARRDV